MDTQFLVFGSYVSIVLMTVFLVGMYIVLAIVSLAWLSVELVVNRIRQLVKLAEEKPTSIPVVPLASEMPLPAIRRKIALK